MYAIPITIGTKQIDKVMMDLGAGINVMPLSMYNYLKLGPMKETRIIIQLADRSNTYPEGMVEDVLVKVHDLIFPADFYVIDMNDEHASEKSLILLGRPFLKTAKTKIDVDLGTLSLEFDGTIVSFNMFNAMQYPRDSESVCHICVIDKIVESDFEANLQQDKLETVLVKNLTDRDVGNHMDEETIGSIMSLQSPVMEISRFVPTFLNLPAQIEKLLPSLEHAPVLELKELPTHLKYVYLGDGKTLPAIIANNLSELQEEKLIRVLRENKGALGWTLTDIQGISPATCMHRIFLEDDSKPARDAQRKLNPPMKEVVLKEILKLLDLGIIFPISDSKWVSPVHLVPKKTGITIVTNEKNELVPTRLQTGWRMCIDYRKLNAATRKDHFPLPFIDQMLERLAGKNYFCFLDGYSGYYQIIVAPEDQEKTTFTCPFGTFAFRRMPFGLCNAPGTFQRCMMSIFSDMIENCIEIFMDDFTVYGDSFDQCLGNLDNVMKRCIETNLILNYEKCHFMVQEGIVLGHIVSA
jgi:hypothetical protein